MSNKYPPPWENHTHYWYCNETTDRCFDCDKTQTFEEWVEARLED